MRPLISVFKYVALTALFIGAFSTATRAESRSERKARENAESAAPQQIAGGDLFRVAKSYRETYASVLNFLKHRGDSIETASAETGQIITAISVKGGWKQTGTRAVITLIEEKNGESSIRAVVTEQKRYKALQVEPWSDPVVEPSATTALQAELQRALQLP